MPLTPYHTYLGPTHAHTALSFVLHIPTLLPQLVVKQPFSSTFTTLSLRESSCCESNPAAQPLSSHKNSRRPRHPHRSIVVSSRTPQSATTPSPWTTKHHSSSTRETVQSWIQPTTLLHTTDRISTPPPRTNEAFQAPQATTTVWKLVVRTASDSCCLVPLPSQTSLRQLPSPGPQCRTTLLRPQGHPWVPRHSHIRRSSVTTRRRRPRLQGQHNQPLLLLRLQCFVSVVGKKFRI
jgi:hypothetical protein